MILTGTEQSLGSQVDEAFGDANVTLADEVEIAVDGIMLNWGNFIPTLNGRSFTTDAELQAWNRMPPWQQNALRLRDDAIAMEGPDVLDALRQKVAGDTLRRTREIENSRYSF